MRNEYYDKDPNQLGLIIGSCDGGIIFTDSELFIYDLLCKKWKNEEDEELKREYANLTYKYINSIIDEFKNDKKDKRYWIYNYGWCDANYHRNRWFRKLLRKIKMFLYFI